VRARIEGRSVDGAAVQAKRRKLMARIRVVSILGVVAALMAIAASAYVLSGRNGVREAAPVTRQDQLAQLLDLVAKGQITGDQAIELARLLEGDAFKDVATEPSQADATPATETLVADAPRVTRPDAVTAARASFADAAATLLQDPDPRVRTAVLKVGQPATRRDGLEEMWAIAREGGASAAPIWRACGALMLATGDDRAARALENARALNPQDKALWRMLSFAYTKQGRPREAAGAAFVGAGLDAASSSDWMKASARLERALPLMPDAQTRSFVLGQLGDAAAADENWQAAETRYRAALGVHGEQKNIAGISMDASKLARAQLKQGEEARACATLRRARQQGATVTEEELRATCADVEPRRRPGATPPG
jgi:tetratricopeptide (TPR) repeat protein